MYNKKSFFRKISTKSTTNYQKKSPTFLSNKQEKNDFCFHKTSPSCENIDNKIITKKITFLKNYLFITSFFSFSFISVDTISAILGYDFLCAVSKVYAIVFSE